MKNLRNCYAAFLLFALLSVSAAAPAQTDLQQKLGRISTITETRPLESTRFSEKYVTYFTQPLDHRRPEKGSFRQRVIVSHVGFDRPTVIVTEGYGAAYALNPKYREELSELLDISNPDYFIADSPTASFFVQAARELGYYGYDTKPFKKYLSIQSSKGYLHRLMLPEELKDMPFDKTLSKKITKFLKENDPKMIFIYGQNDPWTAAGVTWLKGKKNIHVFVEPGGSHRARIGTLPEEEKKQVMELINEWLKQ